MKLTFIYSSVSREREREREKYILMLQSNSYTDEDKKFTEITEISFFNFRMLNTLSKIYGLRQDKIKFILKYKTIPLSSTVF